MLSNNVYGRLKFMEENVRIRMHWHFYLSIIYCVIIKQGKKFINKGIYKQNSNAITCYLEKNCTKQKYFSQIKAACQGHLDANTNSYLLFVGIL